MLHAERNFGTDIHIQDIEVRKMVCHTGNEIEKAVNIRGRLVIRYERIGIYAAADDFPFGPVEITVQIDPCTKFDLVSDKILEIHDRKEERLVLLNQDTSTEEDTEVTLAGTVTGLDGSRCRISLGDLRREREREGN